MTRHRHYTFNRAPFESFRAFNRAGTLLASPGTPLKYYSSVNHPSSGTGRRTSVDRLMEIGGRLREFPFVWKMGAFVLRAASEPCRARQIRRYLYSSDKRQLRFGSGRHTDAEWLSADIIPLSRGIVYMDARKPLPLPSDSFDFILCEHMIEHLDLRSARHLLEEFARVLRRGGILRIATPDLRRLVLFVTAGVLSDDALTYVRALNEDVQGIPQDDGDNPVYMINRVVRDWGHTFLYDELTLRHLLELANFSNIVRGVPGESEHPKLVGVERHQEEVGRQINLIETLLLEAVITK